MKKKPIIFVVNMVVVSLFFGGIPVHASVEAVSNSENANFSVESNLPPELDTSTIDVGSSNDTNQSENTASYKNADSTNDSGVIVGSDNQDIPQGSIGGSDSQGEVENKYSVVPQNISKIDMNIDWRPEIFEAVTFSASKIIDQLRLDNLENKEGLNQAENILKAAQGDQQKIDSLLEQASNRGKVVTLLIGPNYGLIKKINTNISDIKNISNEMNLTIENLNDQRLKQTLDAFGAQLNAESLMYGKKMAELANAKSLFGWLFKFFA